jgi:hypothetical protein
VLAAAGVSYAMGHSMAAAAGQIGGAGRAASTVPMIGQALSTPFGRASGALDGLANQGAQSGAAVAWWAVPLGVMVVVVPVLLLLPWWALLRLRFAARARATRRAWVATGGREILAVKAIVALSPRRLSRLGPDLVGRWRRGDAEATERLAAAYVRGM